MDVDLQDLADRVRPYVRQAPTDTILQALIDTIRDFCNITRAYQYEASETVQALVSDYDYDVPSANVEAIAIEQMTVDGSPAYPKTADWLTRYVARDWRTRQAMDFRYYTTLQPQTFTFPCVPTAMGTPGGIAYRLSLRPKLSASVIDDAFAAEWMEAFSTGALWRLKSMGGDPAPAWYDPKGAIDKRAEYWHARGQARIRVSKGYGNAEDTYRANPKSFAR